MPEVSWDSETFLAHAYGDIEDRRVCDLIETDLVRTLHELEHLYNSQRLS